MEAPIATSRSVTGISTGKLALYWVIASEIVIFGGLLVCYLLFRFRNDEWGIFAKDTKVWWGAFNTFVLLTSSYFVVLAHHAAEQKDTQKAFKFLWFTIGGGLVFLCVKSIEYSGKFGHGIFVTTNPFWGFYFIATGIHGLHVIAGMICMGIVSFQAKAGKHLGRVELVGLYWHFVDIVWIFLFPLLYIAK
jgi:heme/copper-type cytochrome/quinol oxidase subunit 3